MTLGVAAAAALLGLALLAPLATAAPPLSGAIFTTLEDGTRVNANIYQDKRDVYLDGGPGPNAPQHSAGLPDGNYYFQVTDPPGKVLLSTDPVKCREFRVAGGIIVEYLGIGRTYTKGNQVKNCYQDGKANGLHDLGLDIDHGALTIQLMPYDDTPNKGGVYKAWATPTGDFQGDPEKVDNPCGNGCFHGFLPAASKTDNFKVKKPGKPFTPPMITVRKFVDTDGDGIWDAGEPEVGDTFLLDGGGWPVHITDPNGAVTDGFTPFTYLAGFAGAYLVCEDLPAGWSQTVVYVDGAAQTVTVCVTVNVAFTSGETHTVVYGNFECLEVNGYKFNDLDGDGTRDAGEPGIAGWGIDLYRNGVLYATTTTDASGFYSFSVCAGGNYEVREEIRAGWSATTPTGISFTASSGVDHLGLNFLNFQCFAVSGKKINDLNGNGVADGGEPGLAGWTIQLWRNGALFATTVTAADGSWSFSVCQGGNYEVKEVAQADWIQTAPAGGSFTFAAVSGTGHPGLNFLNFRRFDICGEKWYDSDKDGTHDGSEVTIEGWRIELYRNGVFVAQATTGADGRYCFTDLGPGNYEVREVMPNNPGPNEVWAQTFPGGDGDHDIPGVSGGDVNNANFGNACEFTEGLTWGYWKTHTGYDSPPKDPAYDLLPANPMPVDLPTSNGDYEVDSAAEAKELFDMENNCSGDCRSLFRAQLLALHMNLLKFGSDMTDSVYVYPGDSHSGDTVQEIYDDAIALLTDGNNHDFGSFKDTLDRINNNGHLDTGSHVLVCAEAPDPEY